MGLWVPSLSFSTDNRALALSSVGGTVRLFSRTTGDLLFQLVQPNLRVSQVRYRPGPPGVLAQYLASLGGDNTVFVWDVAYKKFLGALTPGPSGAEALEISGDGHWLAAASGNAVLVWDMNTLPANGWSGAFTPTLTLSQAGVVTGLALSQDGVWLAASNADGTIELWSLADALPVGAFGPLNAQPARLAFSPDEQLLAAAYSDQVIRVWALSAALAATAGEAATPLAQLAGHTARITSVAFSPDGSVLASSSWDGTVRLWAVGGKQ
jgi:WD40 repeat protein